MKNADYQVALSFAGENRDYVSQVASRLVNRGVRVFYDEYEKVSLWGKDLYTHLSEIYRTRAEYTVVFISEHYARKLWTNHERKAAQARAFEESREYILPAIFDDTTIEGIHPTVGRVDLRTTGPIELADLIEAKLIASGQRITAQNRLTNSALRERSLAIASELRQAKAHHDSRQQALIFDRSYQTLSTEEERTAGWNHWSHNLSMVSHDLMRVYETHKSEIGVLKEELLLRLNPVGRDKSADFMYTHPTNPLGLEAVLMDFEKLALSLPSD